MGLFRDCSVNQRLAAIADQHQPKRIALCLRLQCKAEKQLAAIADQCLEASCLRLQISSFNLHDEGASSACAEAAVAQLLLKPEEEPQLN